MPLSQLSTEISKQEDKLLACVHCGLCLEACPTYVATGDENDGPRGRVYLMRAVDEDRLGVDSPTFERHIDRCLGCRACEAACPAGVEYGQLLESSRAELFSVRSRPGIQYKLLKLLLCHVWLHPLRLKVLFGFARMTRSLGVPTALRKLGIAKLISPQMEFALALLESSASQLGKSKGTISKTAIHRDRNQGQAMLFSGCVGEGLFARVNRATGRVLKVNGYEVDQPRGQVCCGALHAHAGDLEGARQLARNNIEAFASATTAPIVTNAGGCGAMLASYEHLLADDPQFKERAHSFSARVRDVSELLAQSEPLIGNPVEGVVTYDASCHLLYGQHAAAPSLEMIRSIPGVSYVPLKDQERCCGGAGIYNLMEPELSRKVLREKLDSIRSSGGEILATGNPGCQMQIGAGARLAGMDLAVCHPVELLDESYRQAGHYNSTD